MKYIIGLILPALLLAGCRSGGFDVSEQLDYCHTQVTRSLSDISDTSKIPRNIENGGSQWHLVGNIHDWTSGFWPGVLWLDFEHSQDDYIRNRADYYTEKLRPLSQCRSSHDIGFQMMCSFGNAYRITGDDIYKKPLLDAARWLADQFDPLVGTIHSWPWMVEQKGWPHNTIIDNMMNLELLFWASANGGDPKFREIAVQHARTTMEHHFREDWSCYHVAVYDTISGNFIKGVTHQGYADGSMWARGQAWAIYGYTMAYRETGMEEFLSVARNAAAVYLDRLPDDMVPYWDFDAPGIPDAPRDASAGAIAASALLELSVLVNDESLSVKYRKSAEDMLKNLSSEKYQARGENTAFLKHSTGHYPEGYEIDSSIIYADYYYIEALHRLKRLEEGRSIQGSSI